MSKQQDGAMNKGFICICPTIADVLSWPPEMFKKGYPKNTAEIRKQLEAAYAAGQITCCGHAECEEEAQRRFLEEPPRAGNE